MKPALNKNAKPRLVDAEAMRAAVLMCRRKGMNGTELTWFLTTHCIVDLDLLSEILAEIRMETESAAA